MASGKCPVYVVTVEDNDLRKLNMKQYVKFKKLLDATDVKLSDFAKYYKEHELDDDLMNTIETYKILEAFDEFKDKFKSRYGLKINIDHHDKLNEGDIYDSVDGVFFSLDFSEIYQLTDKAKKLNTEAPIEIKQFVIYG